MSSQTENSSELAEGLSDELLEEHKQLSPEERLDLFLSHNRVVAQLQEEGERKRSEAKDKQG